MNERFKISLFNNKRDTAPRVVERNWEQLCSNFQKPLPRNEKDGPLFCPAIFEPAYRLKKNVQAVSLLVLDIDHGADLSTLKTLLSELNAAYAIYSTHSHLRITDKNPNAEPRFRVVLPLVSSIPAKDFPSLWQYAKQKTGLPLDEAAKDCSRMFYIPAIADSEAEYVYECKEGAFLDWQQLPLESYAAITESVGDTQTQSENGVFQYHEDRNIELCRRVAERARSTGRGTYEMKCPSHNGTGDSSLFYDPAQQSVACLKKPNGCGYFDILKAFDLPNGKLPSREHEEKLNDDFEKCEIKVTPFPVPSEKCFYGLAGDFVRLVEPHSEASPMALLAQFLGYGGNIMGRTAYYLVEGDRHYTNINCLLVGKTAQGRKGTSLGRVKQFFKGVDEHHEKECLVGGLASGEGLLFHVRDACFIQKKNPETGELEDVLVDGGVSDKRLLVTESEFAQVLSVQGRDGNTLSTYLRNFWDTGTVRSLTKNSPLKATDAHITIIGHITGFELLSTLTEVESANGYANRFLYFAVKRARFLPFGGHIPPDEIYRIQERIREAVVYARERGQTIFSIEASRLWAAVYEGLETSRFGYLAKITQRASPYVLRLSLIFALLDKSPLIEKAHLEAALAVWQYSEDSARYVFGQRLEDPHAEKILTALKDSPEGLTRTEIRDLFERHIKNNKLTAALTVLLENGLAEQRKEKTGGRSAEVWFACVLSDKSVQSAEKDPDEGTLDAFNAYNAPDTRDLTNCANCGLKLELIEDDSTLFCPMGCGSIKIK